MNKNLIDANIKLLDENKQIIKDIQLLSRYIKGEKDLKQQVIEIIEYYENKKVK